ncbi:MAG: F0F1 ATP synthase subunit A [Chloroflexota bacterium]|nr:MAG: F0F1 ATP synthase subunit A [Chloroflexota bacterium]
MELSPDSITLVDLGIVRLNATVVYSWVVLAVLVVGSALITRRLTVGPQVSRWQSALEALVSILRSQIADMTQQNPDRYLPFIGTLFLFIAVSNLLAIIPGFSSPVSSVSTTAALAFCVFIAVPVYGVMARGLKDYLRAYIQPTFIMLPLNILSELSRTLALAIRLFGNALSGDILVAILIVIVPLFVPIVMQLFGLVIGLIQAYIFAILATVFIASATRD